MTKAETNYLLAAMKRLERIDAENGRPGVAIPLHEAMEFIDVALGRKTFECNPNKPLVGRPTQRRKGPSRTGSKGATGSGLNFEP